MKIFDALPVSFQLVFAFVGVVIALIKALRFVKEAELGLRLRFGKVVRDKHGNPKVIKPGFVIIIPFIENLEKHHTREQPLTLKNQQIILRDKSVFHVNAAVYFKVHDIYKALFEINDVKLAFQNYCMGVLRDTLQELANAEEILDTATLSATIADAIKEKAAQWGLELTGFKITDCAPTAETASFLNAGAAVKERMKALKEVNADTNPQLAAALLGAQTVNTVHTQTE